mgnify:CR=1 FL=1
MNSSVVNHVLFISQIAAVIPPKIAYDPPNGALRIKNDFAAGVGYLISGAGPAQPGGPTFHRSDLDYLIQGFEKEEFELEEAYKKQTEAKKLVQGIIAALRPLYTQ